MLKHTFNAQGQVLEKGVLEVNDGFTAKLVDFLEKSLAGNEKLRERALDLYKGLETITATSGGNLVDSIVFRGIIEKIKEIGTVAPLFDDILMPTNIYQLPIEIEPAQVFGSLESTTDHAFVTTASASTPTVGLSTLTAFKLRGKSYVSTELEEDAVIDVIQMIIQRHAGAIATGFDQAILDGDTAVNHQDSNVTDPRSTRKLTNGLRKLALAQFATTGVNAGGDAISLADIDLAQSKMGKFAGPKEIKAGNVALICEFSVYNTLKNLASNVSNNNQISFDMESGVLRAYNGIKIVYSEDVLRNLNASGVFDGSTTDRTYALLVNTSQFVTGTRSNVRLASNEDLEADRTRLYSRVRKAFSPIFTPSASNTNLSIIRNILA